MNKKRALFIAMSVVITVFVAMLPVNAAEACAATAGNGSPYATGDPAGGDPSQGTEGKDATGGETSEPDPVPTVNLGAYGKKAKALYKISDENIIEVSKSAGVTAINNALDKASGKASDSSKAMVYVQPGTHSITSSIFVPKNVVLVGEKASTFTGKAGQFMVRIKGSVYGGTYDSKNGSDTIMWFEYEKFTNKNGEVRYATIQNAKIDAIHYGSANNRKKISGAVAVGNIIRNCKTNGITVVNGASMKLISGNKISKIGKGSQGSAISVTHAAVTTISKNVITAPNGHGISTDTDFKGMVRKSVTIGTISGNTITKPGGHGIWVDNYTTIKKINSNVIKNSKNCGIAIELQGKVKSMNKNTITKSKKSNVTMNGKGGYLVVGSGNKITNSKAIGIMVNGKATCKIIGTKNVIKGNKNDVRWIKSKGAKFTLKYKKKNTIPNIRKA